MKRFGASSACVVVFQPGTGLVLAERHSDGYGLPGGRREEFDNASVACAARELFEETGVRMREGVAITTYDDGEFVCDVFLATIFDLPERLSHGAEWVEPEVLVLPSARFPSYCARIFASLVKIRNFETHPGFVGQRCDWNGSSVRCSDFA
jgi:8-oxo-dGTP pyrophosphatase MutT (NUDIX family)